MNYKTLKLKEDASEYEERFFRAMSQAQTSAVAKLAWSEAEHGIDIFASDLDAVWGDDLMQFVLKENSETRSNVNIYSIVPFSQKRALSFESESTYAKLVCFRRQPFECDVESLEDVHVELIDHYDDRCDQILRNEFIEDHRLYLKEKRMKKVYDWEVNHEFAHIKGDCEHRYVLSDGKLRGYVCTFKMPEDVWGQEYSLVACIWIDSACAEDKALHDVVRSHLLGRLMQQKAPYAAAIYSNNLPSLRFFEKNRFLPHSLRVILW